MTVFISILDEIQDRLGASAYGTSTAVRKNGFERFRNLDLAGVEIPFLDSESLVRNYQGAAAT